MFFLPCAALLASVASAASTPDMPQNSAVKMDFSVLRGSSLATAQEGVFPELVKRDGSPELSLTNEQTYYAATLKVGSHGAQNSVVIDTGSSDLWIMASDAVCSSSSSARRSLEDFSVFSHRRLMHFEVPTPSEDVEKRADIVSTIESVIATHFGGGSGVSGGSGSNSGGGSCTSAGSFDTAASNSFKVNSSAPQFSITYADNTFAQGFWGTDYVDFGSANVSDCSMAVVNYTSSDTGVLGIGFAGLETTYSGSSTSRPYTYQNFPLRLKNSGAINKVLYSLYLNSASASSGSVLFGAVDHAKYSGQLQTVPIVNIYAGYYAKPIRFDIVLDSITLTSSSQNVTVSSTHIPALLDSGTTLSYLPSGMMSSLVSSLGGSLSSSGYYRVSCGYNSNNAYAVFNFSGVEIRVPMSDLILTSGSTCYLGVMSQSSDSLTGTPYAILGDNFLRNAYIVYDLEDYEVSLAQVNYSSTEDIETVSSSVPSAVQAPNYSSTSIASSVGSGTSGTPLSSSGTKKSQGSRVVYYAKSLLFGVAGVCVVFLV